MTNWKYTDATNTVAFRTLENGGMESMLSSALPSDAVIDPADVPPPPTVAQQLAALDAENALTQRNLRDTILLMAEAFKTLSGGALDLTQLPGVAKVVEVEAAAAALRVQL